MNDNENLTVTASQIMGYVFSMWTLNGVDYSTNSTVIIPAQLMGTRNKLHATFTITNPEIMLELNWLLFQLIGLGMIASGGYLLWILEKRKSTNTIGTVEILRSIILC